MSLVVLVSNSCHSIIVSIIVPEFFRVCILKIIKSFQKSRGMSKALNTSAIFACPFLLHAYFLNLRWIFVKGKLILG